MAIKLSDVLWQPEVPLAKRPEQTFGFGCIFAGLYILLAYVPSAVGVYEHVISFNSWIFYPPAFVRLVAFLVLGFWSVPFIFVAQLMLGAAGFDPAAGFASPAVAFASAVGAPLAAAIAARAISLKTDLSDLNGLRLLVLSIACACGNALFLRASLMMGGQGDPSTLPDYISIIAGDTIGTWAVIYVLKGTLIVFERWPLRWFSE